MTPPNSEREKTLGYEVEWRWAWDWQWEHPQGAGKVIGRCDAPQLLVEMPDGSKMWWRADLTRPKDPQ